MALVIAWGGWLAERRRARVRLERLEQKHTLERERIRIARDIHDDLGANLTQIVFLSEKADSVRADTTEAERCNQRIRSAARSSLQSLDEIVWAVSPDHDTLESFTNYLIQFVREYPTLAGMRCHLDVPTVPPQLDLSAEVRHNLLLAVREAVQNVVSHAAATELQVALQLGKEALEIVIIDNGRGFQLESLHSQGHGLLNMRQRLTQIGGQCAILSQPGAGTTVRFCLSRKHFHINGQHVPSS
jgi:signal transduction histidine kinase